MESTGFRLLISARDPGAANNLAPIALLAKRTPGIHLELVASPPADRILRSHGLQPRSIAHDPQQLPATAARLIDSCRPQAILVGLSGPEGGIDEALLASAGDIPSWALQDFWGDINNGFGSYADTYLVRDTLAARITRERAPVNAEVTGSPQRQSVPSALRQRLLATRLRKRHRIQEGTPLLVLAGQPLWQQPGYPDSLRDTLRSLPAGRLLVRMHPRDGVRERMRMRKLLRNHSPLRWSFSDDQFDALLAAADLMLSAFSNCGVDKAMFNRRAPRHAGAPVYLLHNPRLRRLYRQWTGLDDHPLGDLRAAVSIHRKGELRPGLQRALGAPARAHCGRASRLLAGPGDAADRVLRKVISGKT